MASSDISGQGAQPAHPLGVALMDDDHARLEELIGQAPVAADADLPALHEAIVRELEAHFSREEDLMRAHDFPGLHCHMAQHRFLVEEARRPAAGESSALRHYIAVHIAQLVESHVLTLDSITAAFIRGEFSSANFDNLRLPVEPARP
ncbi:MAG TPA: hemerythrin family protein [Rhodoblastus sp.]|nr:hemerythrin family protein [Rhodoblastus sp.]